MRKTAPRKVRFEPTPPITVRPGIRPAWLEEEEGGEPEVAPIIPPRRTEPIKGRRRMPTPLKIIAWVFGTIILLPIAIAIVIGSVEGIAGNTSSAPAAVQAGDPYHDCLTLADRDRFAPEVCEPLNPDAKVAKAATDTSLQGVANFNDGFATSKQDDCDQGFAPACTWLKLK